MTAQERAARLRRRAEMFGYDTDNPWAADALRLLHSAPRIYDDLVRAWDVRFPGTVAALERLRVDGWVDHQGPVVIDTRTAEFAQAATRPVDRYLLTAAGKRHLAAIADDERVIHDLFPKLTTANARKVVALAQAFHLDGSHLRFGLSGPAAIDRSGLAERTGRYWVQRLHSSGWLRRLPHQVADTRAVIPAHWRPNATLRRQLRLLVREQIAPAVLAAEFRLDRYRTLADIDPARVGVSGATDWDHDVQAQAVMADLFRSSRCAPEGVFRVEPRHDLGVDDHVPGRFDSDAATVASYLPDVEYRERDSDGRVWRAVLEYERYQSRRDGWAHIERFLGWLHLDALPAERAVLRFVVTSEARVRAYARLVEAFADYAIDHPERMPVNPVMFAVAAAPTLAAADDPLDERLWHRIALPQPQTTDDDAVTRQPVLHHPDHSPYDTYFAAD